jgi:hypothetical protein
MSRRVDKLIDMVVTAEELNAGRDIDRIRRKTKIPLSVLGKNQPKIKRPDRWTREEDEFVRMNLGWMSEHEMGEKLGRSTVAVRLRWKRDLHLPAPSKHPDFITGEQAAVTLGVDNHAFSHWCDMGLIPFRNMTAGRKMRLIYRTTFKRWVISTSNWIYFDWHRITDPHLRRLCELRAQRWGDEWLSTAEVGEMHGVTSKDVQRLIYRGELKAVQVAVSKAGRHPDPAWLNWYVLRSDAEKAFFRKGRGSARALGWQPSARAKVWMLKAWEMGMNFSEICRTMGNPVTPWSIRQYMVHKLKIDLTSRHFEQLTPKHLVN